jgi:hypothetical protein
MVGVHHGICLCASPENEFTGNFVNILGNHIAFRDNGILIDRGAGISISENHLLALDDGSYWDSTWIGLGKSGHRAPVMADISRNTLAGTGNQPKTGIVLDGPCDRIRVGPNFYQAIELPVDVRPEVKRHTISEDQWS